MEATGLALMVVPVLSKGQLATTEQVIFTLLLVMLILSFMAAQFSYSMRGKQQAEILSVMGASAVNALSVMESGEIQMAFNKGWNIQVNEKLFKIFNENDKGESNILGTVKSANSDSVRGLTIKKDAGKPVTIEFKQEAQ